MANPEENIFSDPQITPTRRLIFTALTAFALMMLYREMASWFLG